VSAELVAATYTVDVRFVTPPATYFVLLKLTKNYIVDDTASAAVPVRLIALETILLP
jgi:hypothetical protein